MRETIENSGRKLGLKGCLYAGMAVLLGAILAAVVQSNMARNWAKQSCQENGGLHVYRKFDISKIAWNLETKYGADSNYLHRRLKLNIHQPYYIKSLDNKFRIYQYYNKKGSSLLNIQNGSSHWELLDMNKSEKIMEYYEYGYGGNSIFYYASVFFGGLIGGSNFSTNNICGYGRKYNNPEYPDKYLSRIFEPGRYGVTVTGAITPELR